MSREKTQSLNRIAIGVAQSFHKFCARVLAKDAGQKLKKLATKNAKSAEKQKSTERSDPDSILASAFFVFFVAIFFAANTRP